MEDDLFGGIDLLDIIPLVVVAAVEKAPQYSNKKTVSSTGILSGSDFVQELQSLRIGKANNVVV